MTSYFLPPQPASSRFEVSEPKPSNVTRRVVLKLRIPNEAQKAPIHSHNVESYPNKSFSQDEFEAIWDRRIPFKVSNIKIRKSLWAPKALIEKYGATKCELVDCQSDQKKSASIAEFLSDYGSYAEGRLSYKLKVSGAVVSALIGR
jgi:hypothetical protein